MPAYLFTDYYLKEASSWEVPGHRQYNCLEHLLSIFSSFGSILLKICRPSKDSEKISENYINNLLNVTPGIWA